MAPTSLYLTIMLSPLIASGITGFFGFAFTRRACHSIAILGVLIATILSFVLLYKVQVEHLYYDGALYTWLTLGSQQFIIGALIDSLTSLMLVVVTTVSLMVHIYTIGYMAHEEGYSRFLVIFHYSPL